MFPMAVVNSQPAWRTDFMFFGAWGVSDQSKVRHSGVQSIVAKQKQFSGDYLWVGKLETCDGEHHLSARHEEVLRDLPGHVDGVGLDVFYLLDGASTL